MKERGGGEERAADPGNKCLTHISGSATGRGHDAARPLDL